MKFLQCLAILSVVLSVAKSMSPEDKAEMVKSLSDECKKTEGASDDDVKKLAEEKFPETKEGKCMIACLQEQFGVTKDGAYQEENVKGLFEMVAGEDEAKQKAAPEIAAACKNENDADKCEKAVKIGKCLEKHGREKGFKAPE